MKQRINHWVGEQAQRTGLFAIGVIHPDNTFSGQSCSSIYPPIFLNNSWRSLKDMFNAVREQQQFDALSLRWVYEHACLYAAQRMDGAVLGLYVSRDEQLVPRSEVERLLNDFLFMEGPA
ncbi:MAG: hypothetical protein HYR88_04480 [Verrucomicrobia bacterium]|nr:hypothetical protein [Verrucomicrobiota bacterium]MBI3867046.1 hypothetical protein [Verrucomicrobiota bacterium]